PKMATAIRRAWQKGQSGLCAALVRCGSCSNPSHQAQFPPWDRSASRLPGYFENGGYTERKKNQTKKKGIQNTSEASAEERQDGEQCKVSRRLGVHFPVHGSAARLLAAAGPGSSGHSRLPQSVFKTFELLAVFLGRQIQRHRREAPKAADRDIRMVLLI